ncbi:TonB-dependent receptor [Coralloluteibacterium stylophorae]|uniref:TonB-dependent receptor n=1 Tax=Coralloluteibacterium stylophorae TaxID=1776034 RepID=A0A8J8AWU5_9GAMM|nr:TonB-dependent receptor [Coralloluteibacterium stylophorae]MBS7457961.1 TonB-dependent receptor [Coralloluteibacterium stylophorae]
MPHRRHPLVIALRAGLAAAALPAAAFAQDPASARGSEEAVRLDAMIVTAQKREQQVQEVPIAISAYSGGFLDDYDVRNVSDIGNLVPGLQVQEQSPNNPGFVIRGITSDSGEANVEPRVSVFQDGVSISKSRGSVVQPFDLERVEVLRGPQGTLFGRGAQIGAVHFIQNKAFDGSEAGFTLGAGNYSSSLAEAHANAPIVDDVLFGRIAVFHEKRDGFVENLSGGDLNGKDTNALRASFRLDLRDTDTLDLILNYQKDTPPGTAFRSGSIPTRAGSLDVLDRTADLNRGEDLGLDRTVRGATLLGNFMLDDAWSLATITGWRDFDSVEEFDADGAQIHALEFAEDSQGRQVSHEFRFNYDGGGRFTGFGGLSYFHESGTQSVPFSTDERSFITLPAVGLGVPPLLPDGTPNTLVDMLPIAPGVVLPLKPFHQESYANSGETDAWELFADGTFAVTERLNLTLGLRGTREDTTAGYRADFYGVPSFLGLAGLGGSPDPTAPTNILFAPTEGWLTRSETFESAVGRFVVDYAFADDLRGYASISRGRRPNVINVDAFGSEVIDEELVWSSEAGIKGAMAGGGLVYDLALFHYEYTNFQTSVRDDDTLLYVTANGGNATADGAEVALSWRASDSVGVFFNYGWIDARFDDTDDDGNAQELAGNRFRLTPEHSASAGLDLGWDIAAGTRLYLRPSWNWRSQVYFEDDNTDGIEQPGYALYNLRAGVTFGDGRWDLGVYGSNLADTDYLIDAGNTGRLFGTPTFIQGAPRLYGATLRGRF